MDKESARQDEIKGELIKNGPVKLEIRIANILQLTSEGKPFPIALREDMLMALPKTTQERGKSEC